MKEINKMSRLTGELEKMFRMLNEDFFSNALPSCIITAVPTAKAFAHYTPWDAWQCKGESKREINISTAYLARPLENVIASLIHEMVHMYNDCVLHEQDTSNRGIYHNKIFKREAEAHGLIVHRSDMYGWSHTEPSDALLEWILDHEELREIELCRKVAEIATAGTGAKAGETPSIKVKTKSTSRKYVCPCCGNSVRATKAVNIICGDCDETMVNC